MSDAGEAEKQAITNQRDQLKLFAQRAYDSLELRGDKVAAYLNLRLALGIDEPAHTVGERWWERPPYNGGAGRKLLDKCADADVWDTQEAEAALAAEPQVTPVGAGAGREVLLEEEAQRITARVREIVGEPEAGGRSYHQSTMTWEEAMQRYQYIHGEPSSLDKLREEQEPQ